jgi:RND family efflux transporter MFP subunit
MPREFLLRSSRRLFVLAGLVVAGCGGTAPGGRTREAPRVTVAHPVIRSLLDEDDYNGWLEAFKTVDVRARVRGQIVKVHFNEGDLVKVGQPLFDLDPAPFLADVKRAEAQARALQAEEGAAKKVAQRNRLLARSDAVAQQELEKSEADALSYEAQIAAKKAEVERLRLDLDYAKITAEQAGKISKAALTEGNLVTAGASDPVLTTIVAIDPIYVDFSIDERAMQRYQEIGAARRGQEKEQTLRELNILFSFGLDTEKGFPHQGRLVFSDNKYTPGTGTIAIRGLAENPDGRLIAGSRVRVRIPVSDKYAAAVIPATAVLADQDRSYLLVLGKDNIVLRRDITPGRLLEDGMRVILPAPGEEDAAGGKDWIKSWEKQCVLTLGLQRARIDYPVEPLDSNGQPIGAASAAN